MKTIKETYVGWCSCWKSHSWLAPWSVFVSGGPKWLVVCRLVVTDIIPKNNKKIS